jgi:tetratricopeptide (TPR) repeat protein
MTRLAFIFLGLLAAARPAPAYDAGQAAVLCEDIKKPFFTLDCSNGACLAFPGRRESQAAVFRTPKPAGVRRIFILGESAATLLLGGPAYGAPLPGFEIINCGVGGYETYRIEGVFREVLKYQPDLIVMLSGNNEGGTYPCPGLRFDLQRRYRRLLERYYSLRLPKEDAEIRATLKIQEDRLDAMAAEARKKKVPFMLCTLPANLSGLGPSGGLPEYKPDFLAGMTALGKGDFSAAAEKFGALLKRDPRDLFARFFLGRALQASGDTAGAKEAYLRVIELDPRQDRTSRERNAMIRRVAARHGAGVCDLEKLFYSVSRNGIPDFTQISDGVHWRPAYTPLVWKEVAAAGRAMGLAWLPAMPAARPATQDDEEIRRTFSYALSYLDNSASALLTKEQADAGFLSERALDCLQFIERARPGLLERMASSENELKAFFIDNFWSRHTADRLPQLRPLLTAHLAGLQDRLGNYAKALVLADKAIAMDPSKPYFRIIRAKALSGLGRSAEARPIIITLYNQPELRPIAAALAASAGLRMPGMPVSKEETDASAKAREKGFGLFAAGDLAGAETALQEAARLNPSDAEAALTLCSARFRRNELAKAVEACDLADIAAETYYPEARRRLVSEAFYTKALARKTLGLKAEAAADFKKALQDPPKDWPEAEAARAELKKLAPQP